jgi:hypothetical protein
MQKIGNFVRKPRSVPTLFENHPKNRFRLFSVREGQAKIDRRDG